MRGGYGRRGGGWGRGGWGRGGGWGWGPRPYWRRPMYWGRRSCCLFFALPMFVLPFALVALFATHVL